MDQVIPWLNANSGAISALAALVVALFTGLLFWVTGRQAKYTNQNIEQTRRAADAAAENAKSYIRSERAFVKMSHHSGKEFYYGLMFDSKSGLARLVIQVKNHGRTPARLVGTYVRWMAVRKGQSAPPEPDYSNKNFFNPVTAFLVTNDSVDLTRSFDKIPRETCVGVESEELIFCVYGYVDYEDVFGVRHRGGYARVYTPRLSTLGNNLTFPSQPGYNYDIELTGTLPSNPGVDPGVD